MQARWPGTPSKGLLAEVRGLSVESYEGRAWGDDDREIRKRARWCWPKLRKTWSEREPRGPAERIGALSRAGDVKKGGGIAQALAWTRSPPGGRVPQSGSAPAVGHEAGEVAR